MGWEQTSIILPPQPPPFNPHLNKFSFIMATIAGKKVHKGDQLYHITLRQWGVVKEVANDGQSIVIEIYTHSGRRATYYAQNGNIDGRRELYWHPPLIVDLPTPTVEPLRQLIDNLTTFGEWYAKHR